MPCASLASATALACVTLGARGAVAVLDGQLERAEPPTARLQEAPGAGDAFAAALLVALARRRVAGRRRSPRAAAAARAPPARPAGRR